MNHLLKNAPLKVTDTYYVLTQSSNMTSRRTTKRSASCSPACSTAAATQALPTAATTYDALDLPLTRTISRNDATVTDTFGYNTRSELTSAQVNSAAYAYDYDNIGNRKTAQENAEEITSYQSNNLNQYTMLSVDDLTDFIPDYDADGNQTRVKTSTCIWAITYDAENRPTDFTKVDSSGSTTIHCEYDHMGRRATKQVTTNGNITLHQRYIYRGYLQIACVDLTRAAHPALWLITWDPTQPVATRPLAIQKDATWYTYGWDLTKNICEVYGQHGYIRTAYTYTPYGEVTSAGDVTQPIQWSSEFNDTETALVYYNYRHYNPVDGRWTGRDVVGETIEKNVYIYINKNITSSVDIIGLAGVAKFAHWVTWKLETFGKDIHGANIERIAKYASEITDAHVYEIAQTIHVVTNTARPIRGNQIRYFVFASCECDDGCQLLNNLGATFSIKVEHFVVKPSKLGVGGDDGNRGFSAYLPVPTDNYDEYVQKMTKNKITKLNKWCMDFCGKVEN